MPDSNDELIPQPAQAKLTPEELNEARRKFEAGQTTRRAALKKIGITAGAAFFAMFAVDDLARIAGKRLEQMHLDNKIADDLAKELRSVGVAFATSGASSGTPCGLWEGTQQKCSQCSACSDVVYAHCLNVNTKANCDSCLSNASSACGRCDRNLWYGAWTTCNAI